MLRKRQVPNVGYRSNKPLVSESRDNFYSFRVSGPDGSLIDHPRYMSQKGSVSLLSKRNSEDHIKFHYKNNNIRKASPKIPPSANYSNESRRSVSQMADYQVVKMAGSNIMKTLAELSSVVQKHTIENVSFYTQ